MTDQNKNIRNNGMIILMHTLERFFNGLWGIKKPKNKTENIPYDELSKEQIKFIIMKDIFIRAPLWALFIVAILGILAFFIIWFFNKMMN